MGHWDELDDAQLKEEIREDSEVKESVREAERFFEVIEGHESTRDAAKSFTRYQKYGALNLDLSTIAILLLDKINKLEARIKMLESRDREET